MDAWGRKHLQEWLDHEFSDDTEIIRESMIAVMTYVKHPEFTDPMDGVLWGCNVCIDSCLASATRHLEQDEDYGDAVESAIAIIQKARREQ